MKLVWSITGDSIDIDVYSIELASYWLDNLNSFQKNNFKLKSTSLTDLTIVEQLNNTLKEVNSFLIKANILDLTKFENCDFLDQNVLNRIHETWVKIHHKHPTVVKFMLSINRLKQWEDINIYVHEIEHPHTISYTNHSIHPWQIPNKFGSDILTFDQYQLELHFQNLGRSTYNKWYYYDENVINSDTDNFTHIGGQVDINLTRYQKVFPPHEYISWCNKHKITAYGYRLPLGNFKDYETNLTKIRHLFFKNLADETNRIFFTS